MKWRKRLPGVGLLQKTKKFPLFSRYLLFHILCTNPVISSRTFRLKDDTPDKKTLVGSKVNGNSSSSLITPGSGDSPLGNRKRSGSTGEESTNRISNGADVSIDFDLLKQELITEIRKEMNKVKQEIIEGTYYIIYQLLELFTNSKNFCSYSTGICQAIKVWTKTRISHVIICLKLPGSNSHTQNKTILLFCARHYCYIFNPSSQPFFRGLRLSFLFYCNHDSVDIFSVSYSRIFYVDSWLARIFLMEIR